MEPIVVMIFLMAVYWLPTFIAAGAKHRNIVAIAALNLFGFTGVCWIAALVWALTKRGDSNE